MKSRILFSVLLCALCFASCKKDDPEPPYFPEGKVPEEVLQYEGKEGLLPSVWTQTQTQEAANYIHTYRKISEFKYDDKNRLTTLIIREEVETDRTGDRNPTKTSVEWRPHKYEHRFIYHERGYLVREEVTFDDHPERTIYYAYEDGDIYTKDVLYGTEPSVYIAKITFDEQGRIIRKSDPTGLHYQKFEYDAAGNVPEYWYIIGGDSGWTYTHSYDDRKGAFSCVNTPAWWMALNEYYGWQKNNKITENSREHNHNRIEYQYNAQDFPESYRFTDRIYNYDEIYTISYIEANVF